MPKYNNNFKIENRKLDETIHGVTAIISIWLYIGFIQQIYCPCLQSAWSLLPAEGFCKSSLVTITDYIAFQPGSSGLGN